MTSWYPLIAVLKTSSPVATGTRRAGRLAREHGAVRRDEERGGAVAVATWAGAHRWATASITTGSPRRTVWRTAPSKVRPA